MENPYTHIIFNVSEIDKINFNEIQENSISELRKSIDGTKTFVKWEGNTPSFVQNLTTKEEPYNYYRFISILRTTEWTL
jgi:hypothetical protein